MTTRGSKWFILKITKLFVMVFTFVFAFSVGLPFVYQSFAATPPNIITYQGRVLNSNGVPVSSASETMVFELYDSLAAGSCLWSNSSSTCASATGRSVTLTDGLFSEDLGDTGASYAAIPDTIFADNAAVYLQVTIGGETLSPRKRITAAPYAINAQTVDGLDSTDFDFEQIVSNDGDDTLTASSAFSFASPTSFTFLDDASNTLMTLTDAGTTGNLATTGDLTVTGGDITLGTTSIFSGGDTASLNNIDAIDATTETTFETAIDSLANLTTTGTLTSGATGAGFTVDLDSSTLTCTDCLDFTELADSMTLDADTTINAGNARQLTFQSSLSSGNRTTIPFNFTESNNATYSSSASVVAISTYDVDSTGDVLNVYTAGTGSGININAVGDTTSVAPGVTANAGLNIYNTNNDAMGLSIYSDNTADQDAPLAYILSDNTAFDEEVLYVEQDGTGPGVTINMDGNGVALNIDSEATTANAATIDGSALTTGKILSLVGGNFTDDSGSALAIDVTESTSTADIVTIQTDVGGAGNDVFRIEADGEVFSDVGFTAGAFSTNFLDGSINSTGAFTYRSTGFTWLDGDGNGLLTLTDSGTTGNLATTGDLTVTGGDITLGTTSIFSGGDTASLNNIDAVDATTETTFESAIDSLSNLTTTGTLTSGATGAGFTVDLDSSTLTCTDCLDFDSLADAMTLDAATTITGAAGNGFNVARTLTDATSEFGMVLSVTASDTTSGTTEQFGFVVVNAGSTEGLDNLVRLYNDDTDDAVSVGIAIRSQAGGILTGIEASDSNITTALDVGNNFVLFDGIREAELSTGTLTWEDTSGNDLMTLTDAGTTGTLAVTGDLTVTGGDITLGTTSIFSGGDTASLNNIDAIDATTETTFETAIDSLSNLTTTGTLTSGATGAGFTVDLDSSTLTCTDCLDFTELADSMALDAVTTVTGEAGEYFQFNRTLTDAAGESGVSILVTASDTTSGTTSQTGLNIQNYPSTEGLDNLLFLYNTDTDDSVRNGIAIGSAAGTILTGIDVDDADIVTAIDTGNNFLLFDGIREAELSTGTLTWEDTSGNDLMTLTDAGTTGTLAVTGDLTVTGGDITLGTTSIFSGGDTASLNNIDAIDATTETTFESAIDSLANLTTTGTLTSGATGAGFTVDLDSSTLTCTDCLDFTEFADSLSLDAATTITGAAGETFTIDRTLTDATLEVGMKVAVTASDTTSGTTNQIGFVVGNEASTEALDDMVIFYNYDTDDTVGRALTIGSAGGTITTGIDISDSAIGTALWTGANFLLYDEIRAAELATGTLTWEDTSGNDLMTLVDNGSTGTLTVTDDLVVSGDNIDSSGSALVLNDTTAQPVYIGSGTPGTATGDGDLYVTGDLEVDGSFDIASLNCTDCLDFDDFADSMSLDADTDFVLDGGEELTIDSDLSTANRGLPALRIVQDNNATYNMNSSLLGINQSDTASDGDVINLYLQGTGSGIFVQQLASTGSTTTTAISDAAIMINNTLNNHLALGIYSDEDGDAASALAMLEADNALFDEEILYLDNDGVGIGLYIEQDTVDNQTTGIGNQALVIDVNESANTDEVIMIRSDADGTPDTEFRFENAGTAYADGSWTGSGADYAEYFYTIDTISDNEVVCRDQSNNDAVKKCAAGEGDVVGVISNNPSFVANAGGAEAAHENNANYALVGLMGQIETKVEGTIAAGDPITASATMAGYGAKANGPSEIIGFALDSLASGTGTITVLVNPQWYAGDVMTNNGSAIALSEALALESLGVATSGTQGVDSNEFILQGSGWNGAAAEIVGMTMMTDVTDSADYKLSIQNGTSEVAFVSNSGDLAIAGRLYPSDEGTLQTNKYIYYEGAGDYMRTNAAGWATGSYDFAEMFPAMSAVNAGEVVVFGANNESVMRAPGTPYDQKIAGIVSTRPGFLAGESIDGHVPVALAGRVPTFVNAENGAIQPGDPLTTSSTPGYAMKATEAGPIIGYAMEAMSGGSAKIVVYVNNSYYDGGPVEEAPAADNVVSGISSVSTLDVSGNLMMNGGSILSVSSITNFTNTWRIEENGDFYTRGRLVHVIDSHQNEPVETYATVSTQTTVQLSGTVELVDGNAAINFENVDPKFNDIISTLPDYKVFLTADGPTGALYAINRTVNGFSIRESGSNSSATVDWMVIATHKDFEPETSELLEDNIVGSSTETTTDTTTDTATDTTSVDAPADTTTDTTSTDTTATDTSGTSTTDSVDTATDTTSVDAPADTTTDTSTTDTTTTDTTSTDTTATDSQTDSTTTTTEPTP